MTVFPIIFLWANSAMQKFDGYLRITEAAELLGVSVNTLRNWGKAGKIVEHRHPINNYRLYKEIDLQSLLRDLDQSASRSSNH